MVRRLAVPVPFSMSGFGAALQAQIGRPVVLAPAVLPPGAPSGIWIGTMPAEYLYYQERTSPFHQAHIVAYLAAHLIGGQGRAVLDARLAPDLSPELVRLIVGDVEPSPVSDAEAETFAFLTLAGTGHVSNRAARRLVRELEPLRAALVGVVQEAEWPGTARGRPAARRRLHQAVIEIREAALALRPYRDLRAASADVAAVLAAGLDADEAAAVVEAAVLGHAIRAKNAGVPPCRASGDPVVQPVTGPDLASEAAWLARVSRAFARTWFSEGSGMR